MVRTPVAASMETSKPRALATSAILNSWLPASDTGMELPRQRNEPSSREDGDAKGKEGFHPPQCRFRLLSEDHPGPAYQRISREALEDPSAQIVDGVVRRRTLRARECRESGKRKTLGFPRASF